MLRTHGFEARSGELAGRLAHDLPDDRIELLFGILDSETSRHSGANSNFVIPKP
jgi:hypothetical protein